MPLNSMVSLKKAATAMGMDKADVRSMLDCGAMQGERRVIGSREKWFIHNKEIESFLGSKRIQGWNDKVRTSLAGLNEFFGTEKDEPENGAQPLCEVSNVDETAEVAEFRELNYLQPDISSRIDEILKTLTTEFSLRLCEERDNVVGLQQALAEKEEKIAKLTEAENNLRERIECLDSSKDAEIRALKAHVQTVEERLAERQKPWWKRVFA